MDKVIEAKDVSTTAGPPKQLQRVGTTRQPMISRRTKARIRFLSGLYRATKPTARILGDQDSESGRFDSRYFIFGFTFQIILGWVHDHDYGETRTNNWRRFSVSAILFALALKLIDSIAEDERESLLLGSTIGTVLYRFWYGVFNPLPA